MQVVVALAVTREGLPVRSWVFPGNTTDVATVTKVKRDLKGWKLGRALFVGDAGFNSADNRHQLAKACGTYLGFSVTRYTTARDRVVSESFPVVGRSFEKQRLPTYQLGQKYALEREEPSAVFETRRTRWFAALHEYQTEPFHSRKCAKHSNQCA